jgi:hypothetical protein
LDIVISIFIKHHGLSNLYEGSKLGLIIFDVEFSVFRAIDLGMETGYGNVSHSDISVVTSANSYKLALLHANHMYYSDILKGHTLDHDVVRVRFVKIQDFNWLAQLLDLLLREPHFIGDDCSIWEYLARESLLT